MRPGGDATPASVLEDRFVQVGSVKTRYRQAGSGGSIVLLLHGIGCSVLEWEHNMAALATRHCVLAVDLLGFGLTDKPSDAAYSIERLAQFAFDFLTAHQITRAHFAGNSLGGSIALECARVAPERVASLVLVDPAGVDRRGTLFEFRLATVPLLGELFTRPNRIGMRMLWQKAFADPASNVNESLVSTKLEMARLPGAQAAFLDTLRSFVDFGGFRAKRVGEVHAALPNIRAPTLVIWGRDDRLITVAHAATLQRLMPNVQVQIWDRCGHVPQIECSTRFNEAALDFWSSLEAG